MSGDPYRHPADRDGFTARAWRVTEWQKVYVLLARCIPLTRERRRWDETKARVARMRDPWRGVIDMLSHVDAIADDLRKQ